MRRRHGGGWEVRVCGRREMLTAQVGHGQKGEQELGVVLAERWPALARIRRTKAGQVDLVRGRGRGRGRVRVRGRGRGRGRVKGRVKGRVRVRFKYLLSPPSSIQYIL